MKPGRWTMIAVAVVAATVTLAAGEDIRITPIPSGGRVLVSFAVRDAWTLGTREVLQSGALLRFEYEVELKRAAPFWFFDQTFARTRITSRAQFDTLGARYRVSRMRDGTVVKSQQFSQEADVRDWLTNIEGVAMDPVTPLEPNAEYYVLVRLTTSPRKSVSLWSILPFNKEEITGRQTFTYIK